ncbi:MAG: energy transducer TonB [Bacteroidales bacterium]|jgi:protein TonB|nr:energy transducer TonB [Bacteroidales bacterium]MDD6960553.1 energy transducer TonB [Bacteroidales bacterium]MDY6185839.1 energy transducer TonB [Muribaculaceae bacterium]
MAKDVDLSSKEWCDIVFDGKNKEYGAYQLRATSVKRHTKALLSVVIVLALILTAIILVMTGVFKSADEDINAKNEQEEVIMAPEDIPEEEEQMEIPEQKPEEVQAEEEVAATQAVTEVKIVETVDKDREVKDQEQVLENTAQLGADDHKGVEDVNRDRVVKEVVEVKPVEKPKEEGPLSVAMVEQKPSFPGGESAMYKWLQDNIIYPAAASEEGVQGKVTVQFIVEKDGSITHVQVVRGKHPALDAEAARVIRKMPRWTPGRNNGQPVRVTYHLPVQFKLAN